MTDRLEMPPHYRRQLEALLREHVPDAEVWAYGSRVNGGSHEASDLDLVLRGPGLEPVGNGFHDLLQAIEQSNIPILVQVQDWAGLPESFHREIERDYVVVQEAAKQATTRPWRRVALRDVIDLTLSSVDKKSKADEQAVQLCNYTDVYSNSFIQAGMEFMAATATEREIARCSLTTGDVVITKDSEKHDDIGVPALVRENVPALICGYHLAILRPRPSEVDGTYLFYALSTADAQQQFHSFANGVTRFGLRKADIGLVEIPLPSLPEQRSIAHVLRTLDDKIELNRRMNGTLEAMPRALFKSWFVDFEPVRAKMEGPWRKGASLPGLPADLYHLFPARLVPSNTGEVPEGWEIGTLRDLIEFLGGGTPSTSVPTYWGGDIPWYTAKDAPGPTEVFVLETERTLTQEGLRNSAAKVLPAGTTVITARGTVGRLACLAVPMAMNQTCYGIRGANGYPDLFTYWSVRTAVDELRGRTHGTIFDTITRQTFTLVERPLAPVELAQEFEARIQPTMARILVPRGKTEAVYVFFGGEFPSPDEPFLSTTASPGMETKEYVEDASRSFHRVEPPTAGDPGTLGPLPHLGAAAGAAGADRAGRRRRRPQPGSGADLGRGRRHGGPLAAALGGGPRAVAGGRRQRRRLGLASLRGGDAGRRPAFGGAPDLHPRADHRHPGHRLRAAGSLGPAGVPLDGPRAGRRGGKTEDRAEHFDPNGGAFFKIRRT